jgi:hypothetical protein
VQWDCANQFDRQADANEKMLRGLVYRGVGFDNLEARLLVGVRGIHFLAGNHPEMSQIRIVLYLLLLFAALLQPSLALEAEQNQAALAVEASNGQSTFHIGERVPLKLTFSSPNETEYLIAR